MADVVHRWRPGRGFLGSYLSMRGIDNLTIDKQMHPRAHVGETMVTATKRVFKEIGFLETIQGAQEQYRLQVLQLLQGRRV